MDYTENERSEQRLKVAVKARAGRQKGRRRAAGRREGYPLLSEVGAATEGGWRR